MPPVKNNKDMLIIWLH